MDKITSTSNPRIKDLVKLRKRQEREETDVFLVEGYRELTRAILGHVQIIAFFFCPELFLGENESGLIDQIRQQGADLIECSKTVFEKISYREGPDGLLGVAKKMHYSLEDMQKKLSSPAFLVVAESIEKPGNLGTILRSSDGVGTDGVIVCDPRTDIYNPNVVRSSVGTLFTQPVVEERGEEVLLWLKKNQIQIVATSPHAKENYTQVDLTGPVAIVVGTEQYGLSEKWMELADVRVQIPMKGIADSLNVATATTLLLYEVLRQRSV